MKKLLAIMLVLALVFGMTAVAFASEEEVVNGTDVETTDYEATTEEEAEEVAEETTDPVVVLSAWRLQLDGEIVDGVQPYNINGANYFQLRDLAALMNETDAQFNVTFEAPNMIVTTGEEYDFIGGELEIGEDMSQTAVASAQVLYVDGERADVSPFNIGGNNFFQLRELAALLGFEVTGYDAAERIMMVSTVADEEDEDDADDDDDDDDADEEDDADDDDDDDSDE